MNLNDASGKIKESIINQGEDFYKVDKSELFKNIIDHSIEEDYKKIVVKVFKFFYNVKGSTFYTEKEQYFAFDLTQKIIELILDDISKCISLFDNISQFAFYFNKCSIIYEIFRFNVSDKKFTERNLDSIYDNLSDIYYLLLKYDLVTGKDYKIFPNNFNGELQYFEDIKIVYDSHIERDLLPLTYIFFASLRQFNTSLKNNQITIIFSKIEREL